MKTELTKQFIKKMRRKIIAFIFLMMLVHSIGQAMSPIISNELALTQMQNSNEMFVLMGMRSTISHIVKLIYVFIIGWFVGTIARDTCKFTKSMSTENEKEN